MLIQILVGSVMICTCVIIQTVFIGAASAMLQRIGNWLATGPLFVKLSLSLAGVTLWLLIALSFVIWIWATLFIALHLFDTFEAALYFAIVSFTTLGFGDLVIEDEWRLLSGFLAANGLILFSLTTAFLIEFLTSMRRAQAATRAKETAIPE